MSEAGIPITGAPHAAQLAPATPAMRKAAEDFESMVLSQLLQPMFEALKTDGLGGGGMGEEMFRPMLVEEYAKSIAHGGGVGLARSIIEELQRIQNAAPAPDQSSGSDHGAGR
ncbi:MAG: rod-binding protein [Hyphomonadaceae bacterium]